MRAPDLRVEPDSWCPACEKVVSGRQSFKKREAASWGRYGAQYLYTCPSCLGAVIPGACPASSIIDYSLDAPLIGEREKPLAQNTRERIRRGLQRLRQEPFAIRLNQGAAPKPLTLPLVATTTGQETKAAMIMPVSANTHEATPGNRAKDPDLSPLATVHATLDRALVTRTGHKTANGALGKDAETSPTPTLTTQKDLALVKANTENNVAKGRSPCDAAREAAQTLRTEGGLSLVYSNRMNNVPRPASKQPSHPVLTGGHLGVVVSNYSPGWARRAAEQSIGSVTTQDGHSLVVPYTRTSQTTLASREAVTTLTTRDRLALLTPDGIPDGAGAAGAGSSSRDEQPLETEPGPVTESQIDRCSFRMFSLEEIARAMSMDRHVHGGEYVVVGNRKQRMVQLGNAVTPPVMRLLVGRLLEILDEPA